jgi:ATP-binding cassette, subfamily B, bacterial
LKFPFYQQLEAADCGPACLRMIAKYYGRTISLEYLQRKTEYGKLGVSVLGLTNAAESVGFKTLGAKLTFDQLIDDAPLPAVLHWDQKHFVVLTPSSTKKKLIVADPSNGMVRLSKEEFIKHWISTEETMTSKGVALLLETTPQFTRKEQDENTPVSGTKTGWLYLLKHLFAYKTFLFQVILGLVIGSLLQLVFPYLTQSIVDTGINTGNLSFIQIILAAQLMLLFSQTAVELIRNRLLLYISTRINISLLSEFWAKLLRLPVQFFQSKHPGDILQRFGDYKRIDTFLTGTALNALFSVITLILFSIVLLHYNLFVFIIFCIGSLLYLLWIRIFLKLRRQLDYKYFNLASRENNATIQLIYGMQEIKLNNAESTFRWSWEGLQAGLFKLNFKSLSLNQYQQLGAFFITQGKNILITYIVAKSVVDGSLTLGVMLAVQYIIGQLNSPIEQLILFTQQAQDAKISLERLNEIHKEEDEEPSHKVFQQGIPEEKSIHIHNLYFTYPGAGNEPVLKNINLTIPENKVTAIVGMSGSGKSTLIKLLLRFYENYTGEITIGNASFKTISPGFWRSISGAVMQDSFIFNDNIRKNITVNDGKIDEEELVEACKTANILDFIESLPLGFYTKLGAEGTSISGGQKQRLSIARAVYKNPQFLFFDEATNSLDANNEKVILENLTRFFKNRTVLVVAHRLSTVKNADKIIVMESGTIVEEGTHDELTMRKGKYYELVKNQLELGN